jgi:hypothetical protein
MPDEGSYNNNQKSFWREKDETEESLDSGFGRSDGSVDGRMRRINDGFHSSFRSGKQDSFHGSEHSGKYGSKHDRFRNDFESMDLGQQPAGRSAENLR